MIHSRVSSMCCAVEKFITVSLPQRIVFFFQAEDGIRYLIVTGVQTGALPISSPRIPLRSMRATAPIPGLAGRPPLQGSAEKSHERRQRNPVGLPRLFRQARPRDRKSVV